MTSLKTKRTNLKKNLTAMNLRTMITKKTS